MPDQKINFRFYKLDWYWVGVSYCLYVTFHLLPSFLLLHVSYALNSPGFDIFRHIWLFLGLCIIGFYCGFKSQGITIWEPAIGAILYVLTLALQFEDFWGRSIGQSSMIWIVWILISLVITSISAWVGEIAQQIREQKLTTGGV